MFPCIPVLWVFIFLKEEKNVLRVEGFKFLYENLHQKNPIYTTHYFKLQYVGNLSRDIKNKLSSLCKELCKENVNIKLVFTLFKIKNYFSHKDPIPDES